MTAIPFTLIAGPCVIESRDLVLQIAEQVNTITDRLGIRYIFKASFDKANRSSGKSFRGPGPDEGLKILQEVGQSFGVPVLTDIHESCQAAAAAQAVDVLQIPAFLCRQTDLLEAAAKAVAGTSKVVNVKKGQFLAPWDMAQVVNKMQECGLDPASGRLWLTERGTSFGYNTLCSSPAAVAPAPAGSGSLWHHLPELPSPWGWTVCSWRPIQTPTTPSATGPTWCRCTGSRPCSASCWPCVKWWPPVWPRAACDPPAAATNPAATAGYGSDRAAGL
jgi:hypothetical protein